MKRGITLGETLIALAVLLVFAVIMVPLGLRAAGKRATNREAERMRRLYVGIAMYQEDHFGQLPSLLTQLHETIDAADLTSELDPYASKAGPYPAEPTLPALEEKSKHRVSDAFIGSYLSTGKADGVTWQVASMDPKTAWLVNVWPGRVQKVGGGFEFRASGPFLRIHADGSMRTKPNGGMSFGQLFR